MSKYDHEFMFIDFQGKRISGKLYQQFFCIRNLKKIFRVN